MIKIKNMKFVQYFSDLNQGFHEIKFAKALP